MRNIRLIEDRRTPRQEKIDWWYLTIMSLIWLALLLIAPVARAWASHGWGL